MITEQNWTHTEYRSSNYKAKISIGGEINQDLQFVELYYVSKFTGDELITEEIFKEVDLAIKYVNNYFGHWEFYDHLTSENSSCSSCQSS